MQVLQTLAALEDRKDRLYEAIGSLQRLNEPEPEPEPEPGLKLGRAAPQGPLVSPDSPIAKYIKRGGEGRRLSSAQMVTDVLDEVDDWVNRDEFKESFYKKFPLKDLEHFWEKPENALVTALTRALRDNLIGGAVRTSSGGREEVYGSRAVLARFLKAAKSEEAASSNPDAEEAG